MQNENEFAIYNAVQCADVNWPRNWSKWQSDTERVYQTAPFQAWDNAWFNAACAFWPVTRAGAPLRIKGAGLPPHPDAAGHAGRGHPVRGRAGRAQAAAVRADGGRRGRREPRPVAESPRTTACRAT